MNNYLVDSNILKAKIRSFAISVEIINCISSTELIEDYINKEIDLCLCKYLETDVKQIENIKGYYELHNCFGKKSKKIRPAPEIIIKMIKTKRSIPRINPIVDIYNIISAKYALALGAHDMDHIQGNVLLKFTDGGEVFVPIGSNEVDMVYPGEYAYFDDSNNKILCRLEAKQCNYSRITKDTNRILFIIQGNRLTSKDYLLLAKEELISTLKQFYSIRIYSEYDYA